LAKSTPVFLISEAICVVLPPGAAHISFRKEYHLKIYISGGINIPVF
jgi:hypothetical protein